MALVFVGIDPDTGGDNCPAVFIDEETGDFLLQGWTVTDPGTAVHLETRDAYTPDDPLYLGWLEGKPVPEPALPDWYELVRAQVARGIRFRRARIVSEPLSPFVRFEHGMTSGMNIAAGEDVRWLPRRLTPGLCVPLCDFWVFDDRLVRFGYFAGDGTFLEHELSDDPAVVRTCAEAFEAVWLRAIPHADYRPV